ncbi:MAG: hypothetical protein JWM71_429 [Solirubrobacteraceae bacterium]|nr:hypothetical protein [Solirubrobacteraceae bacterium]
MRAVPRAFVPILLLAGAALAGCGTPGADLFVAQRSGTIPGAALRMRVVDDGEVICNGRSHELDSHDLILARVLANDLSKPAKASVNLPTGKTSILRFHIRTQDGTVAFSDTSPGQPGVFFRAAELIRTLAMGPCGLPR